MDYIIPQCFGCYGLTPNDDRSLIECSFHLCVSERRPRSSEGILHLDENSQSDLCSAGIGPCSTPKAIALLRMASTSHVMVGDDGGQGLFQSVAHWRGTLLVVFFLIL